MEMDTAMCLFGRSLQCTDHILLFTDAQPFHDAPLTRCRLRRGTRHNGVRCMVFIDPETSMHVGTMGHVSSQPFSACLSLCVYACIEFSLYLISDLSLCPLVP